MSEKQLNTIIVLRNDTKEAWEADNSYKLRVGEVGVGYMDVYEGSEKIKTVPIIKIGDGTSTWKQLPQAEGVFENDITLTRSFGRHNAGSGPINAGGKGMTTSEWIIDALSEIFKAKVNQPSTSVTVKGIDNNGTTINDGSTVEIGTQIKKITFAGSFSAGSYVKNTNDTSSKTTYGTTKSATSSSTGLTVNHITNWVASIKETGASDYSANTVTGKDSNSTNHFEIDTFTVTRTTSADIATVKQTCKYTDSAKDAVYTPLNNVGTEDPDSKINASVKDVNFTATATYNLTGYYKPFWGWKSAATALANPAAITAGQIRELNKNGTSTAGLPTSLEVDGGTKQIFFAAKAGTKSSLTVKNVTKEPATGVACTKVANAVLVPGANNYGWDETKQAYTAENGACYYDLWYINLDAPFTGKTKLSLTWA